MSSEEIEKMENEVERLISLEIFNLGLCMASIRSELEHLKSDKNHEPKTDHWEV